jgi:hypothetical protein
MRSKFPRLDTSGSCAKSHAKGSLNGADEWDTPFLILDLFFSLHLVSAESEEIDPNFTTSLVFIPCGLLRTWR